MESLVNIDWEDWTFKNSIPQIEKNPCPQLDGEGFLIFTFETKQNWKVYFSHFPNRPNSFLGDEVLDDENFNKQKQINAAIKFYFIKVSSRRDLISKVKSFYHEKMTSLRRESIPKYNILRKKDKSITLDDVEYEVMGSVVVGLICEKFGHNGCQDDRCYKSDFICDLF